MLVRFWTFNGFLEAIDFVNRVARLAEQAGHHPDIDIRYNRVKLALVSHDAGGHHGARCTDGSPAKRRLCGRAQRLNHPRRPRHTPRAWYSTGAERTSAPGFSAAAQRCFRSNQVASLASRHEQ